MTRFKVRRLQNPVRLGINTAPFSILAIIVSRSPYDDVKYALKIYIAAYGHTPIDNTAWLPARLQSTSLKKYFHIPQ